jgi:LytS/YehU family sensor histidine kinase
MSQLIESLKFLRNIKNAFHVVFISVILFALFRRAYISIPDDWLFFFTSDAVENFTCAVIGYGTYYFVLKLNNIFSKSVFIILFLFILCSIAILKDYRIHTYIKIEQSFEYFTSFLGQSLLFYAGIYFINRLEFLNRNKKLEKELKQAKEQLLRNQLHPHFLFNAFNSLYSLSLKKHPETSDYILKLSSMMRYLTDETHLKKVPFHKELEFIEKYIAIEKIRFGEDARIKYSINFTDKEILIAPFLLITLVENAFKHGFYTNSKDAFVKIDFDLKEHELLFIVENKVFKKQHFQEDKRAGKGLQNLKERLQLIYPKSSNLKITSSEKTFKTVLKITLD